MLPASHNLFEGFPSLVDEWTQRLAGHENARVERIVSHGHASPPGFWYDQEQTEWVAIVKGRARLRFADGATVELGVGDHLTIRPHERHRIEWTTPDEETVWLAVFF